MTLEEQLVLVITKDRAYFISIADRFDHVNAEDIVQTSFLKAFKGLSSFKYKSTLKTWIIKIIINSALESLRKNKRCPVLVDVVDLENTLISKEHTEELILLHEIILGAKKNLKKKQYDSLMASYKEKEYIKVNKFKAIQHLREIFDIKILAKTV